MKKKSCDFARHTAQCTSVGFSLSRLSFIHENPFFIVAEIGANYVVVHNRAIDLFGKHLLEFLRVRHEENNQTPPAVGGSSHLCGHVTQASRLASRICTLRWPLGWAGAIIPM